MSEKKSSAPVTQRSPCRKCGSSTFTIDYIGESHKPGLVHATIKCKNCGAWCGGITKKEKMADRRLR